MAGDAGRQLFENLNFAKNLVVLTDVTAQALLAQIQQIRLPTKVLSVYFDAKAGTHVAWLATTAKVNVITQDNKFKTKGD